MLALLVSGFTSQKSEPPVSGDYGDLSLAFDPVQKTVTGHYESYTGYDEATKQPRFSCIFYLEGKVERNSATVTTYYPGEKNEDAIQGTLKLLGAGKATLQLATDHGGCWNVQSFTSPIEFTLAKKENWIASKFSQQDKLYFYSEKNEAKKLRSYIIKGNIVFIEKIEGDWAFCKYYGKVVTAGWMKVSGLN